MVRNSKPGQQSEVIKPVRKRRTHEKPINTLPVDSTFPLANDEVYLALTEKQKKFIYHYYLIPVTGWSASKCYRMTDTTLTPESAAVTACVLLKRPEIKYCIDTLQKRYNSELGVTTERLMAELANISFSDIADFFNEDGLLEIHPHNLPAHARRAIASFEEVSTPVGTHYKIKLWDKLNAIKQIVGLHGLAAPKKHEISGPNGQPIQYDVNHKVDLSNLKTKELELLMKIIDKLDKLPQELQV